ncbi:hypothetical protein JIR001_14490 [Polycladomyces abyssicola]|uniref:Uncharacterized protein n=1 Tax=Polycladomyces abyssicola TaxID=1125966 RepID=A0A8D5UFT0_9BACL|nr:hypothetical protein [Polycladomyces abyssicola]BCU81666.1 hypothetical protein JIR001_14490 [Polycladomyces abyssicola]
MMNDMEHCRIRTEEIRQEAKMIRQSPISLRKYLEWFKTLPLPGEGVKSRIWSSVQKGEQANGSKRHGRRGVGLE